MSDQQKPVANPLPDAEKRRPATLSGVRMLTEAEIEELKQRQRGDGRSLAAPEVSAVSTSISDAPITPMMMMADEVTVYDNSFLDDVMPEGGIKNEKDAEEYLSRIKAYYAESPPKQTVIRIGGGLSHDNRQPCF